MAEVKQEKATESVKEEQRVVPQADYERLVQEYEKVVKAFNKLLEEYNTLHLKVLLEER